jgi:hypothetical protein
MSFKRLTPYKGNQTDALTNALESVCCVYPWREWNIIHARLLRLGVTILLNGDRGLNRYRATFSMLALGAILGVLISPIGLAASLSGRGKHGGRHPGREGNGLEEWDQAWQTGAEDLESWLDQRPERCIGSD